MRVSPPASRTKLRLKILPFDLLWVIAAPFIALALRDPALLNIGDFPESLAPTYHYALISIACAIPAFLFFRVSECLSRFFSVHDALIVCAAAACAVAASSLVLFMLNRLDGVPRSTPLIYGLVLTGGLIFMRTAARLSDKGDSEELKKVGPASSSPKLRRVMLIGVDRFAATAIKLVDCQRPRTTQVVAALDARPTYVGRKIGGVPIVGVPEHLSAVVDEYLVHGVRVDEVWLSDEAASLPDDVVERLHAQCSLHGMALKQISEAFNLAPEAVAVSVTRRAETDIESNIGDYFKVKRMIDVVAAVVGLVVFLPLAVLVGALTLYDVGTPLVFWQERVGKNGRKFFLYKFRTYHAPFDKHGERLPDTERLSGIGRFIRASRIDEIPQLYNVLVGDMSLIGPRPLLPKDQPSEPGLRLLVRPGITGWAQINGGTSVTPDEKNALDIWYILHASLWLDVKILINTLWIALTGEKLNRAAIAHALHWRREYFSGSVDGKIHGGAFERDVRSVAQRQPEFS